MVQRLVRSLPFLFSLDFPSKYRRGQFLASFILVTGLNSFTRASYVSSLVYLRCLRFRWNTTRSLIGTIILGFQFVGCVVWSRAHTDCRMQCQSFQKFGRTRTVREVRSVYVAEPDRQASRVQELWQMSSLTGGICRKKNRLGLGGETSGYIWGVGWGEGGD